jgi:hypothetical protein
MVCVALTAGAAWAAPSGNSDPKVPVYFQQHCLKCQDAAAEKGDLRIDHLSPKVDFGDTLVQWSGKFGCTRSSQDLSGKSLIDKYGQLAMGHLKLTSRHLGRDCRLMGVHGEIVKGILV